jgi:hypothetical protein
MKEWWKFGSSDTFEKASARNPAAKRRSRFYKTVTFTRVIRVETQYEAASATQNDRTLALVMNGKKAKWILFRCPCGCGELLRINLSPANHPCWRLRISRTGKLSIFPSIDRDSGCRAHFYLTGNVARLL